MSARNGSFLYWLVGRLARGAVPVDGMLWFDPREASRDRRSVRGDEQSASPSRPDNGCEGCPSPIY